MLSENFTLSEKKRLQMLKSMIEYKYNKNLGVFHGNN